MRISLFNLIGERVAELTGSLPCGEVELVWDCGAAAPGIYLAYVKATGTEKKLKLAITK
jgi:hypothetical protein